jgi:hypothetical protein
VGYKQLKETVEMLQSLEAAFGTLKDQVLGANLSWLPKASLTESGITQLSSTYSPSESFALTPKALNDFRQAISAREHLPYASLEAAGIVQLVDSYTTPDPFKAPTAKAVCDLCTYVGNIVESAQNTLAARIDEAAEDIRDQLTSHIDETAASISSDLQEINTALSERIAALESKAASIETTVSNLVSQMDNVISRLELLES